MLRSSNKKLIIALGVMTFLVFACGKKNVDIKSASEAKPENSKVPRKQHPQNPDKHELDNMPLYIVDPNYFPSRIIVVDPNGYIIRYY